MDNELDWVAWCVCVSACARAVLCLCLCVRARARALNCVYVRLLVPGRPFGRRLPGSRSLITFDCLDLAHCKPEMEATIPSKLSLNSPKNYGVFWKRPRGIPIP